MVNQKKVVPMNRLSVSENAPVVRWLRPLLHTHLPRLDVFVPEGVTEAMLTAKRSKPGVVSDVRAQVVDDGMEGIGKPPRFAFYFTVPSEHWSCLCVAGSSLTQADADARRAVLENQKERATTKDAKHSAAVALKKLRAQERRGLVPPEELLAQRHAFRDDASVREAWGKFRVYRSHPAGVEELAGLFEELGYVVVPVLPAFSWREIEFPHDDPRYRVPMVHVQTRTPCPWSKQSLERRLFVHR